MPKQKRLAVSPAKRQENCFMQNNTTSIIEPCTPTSTEKIDNFEVQDKKFVEDISQDKEHQVSRFVQRLPGWIAKDPGFQKLKPGQRFALMMIAARCNKPNPTIGNSLLPCISGDQLYADIGCCRSTAHGWFLRFEKLGFIVKISQGGGNLANVYGIPGKPGALDAYAVPKGAKPAKWTGSLKQKNNVQESDTTCSGIGHPPSEDHTPPVRELDTTIPLSNTNTKPLSSCNDEFSSSVSKTKKQGDEKVSDHILSLLQNAGVQGKNLITLAKDPKVTEAKIKYARNKAESMRNLQNPGGYIAKILMNPAPPMSDDPKKVYQAIAAGMLAELDGMAVGPGTGQKARYNAQGLHILDENTDKIICTFTRKDLRELQNY